ncbi:MAG TPA: sigma-54 dependent transcriptional regulator [Pyrinomonadaceae bacterium]|nr:sigma-54 dependent transcriptional regulator [Pyrinomonadaceae bacterium]
MAKLLIVDDEESYRQVLSVIFKGEGYAVETAANGHAALTELKKNPFDLIISDVRMPDMDGIALLKAVRELPLDVGIVLTTAFGTIDTAREAFKLGADDFIQKPFNNEELKLIVRRTLERQAIVSENRAFRRAQQLSGNVRSLIGESAPMRNLFGMIEAIARERSTVLITGESGTGKELVARAVHNLSDRADKPFIPINCGAMPEHLLEAELFGFIKGTFTGAEKNRTGLFESADGGTIFLDEIGDMPPAMQVKILRVLQDGHIRPVGSANEIPVDTRVIAATNRDIRKMVEEETFRRDLYYRLSVIPLHIPPLRTRREDIPALTEYFIKKFAARSGKKVGISAAAMKILENRDWDGNVRELEHTIERAVALTFDGEIQPEHCSDEFSARRADLSIALPADGLHLPTFINGLEKDLVCEALSRTNGNQTRAAALLQIPVYALRHLLVKHGLHNHNEQVKETKASPKIQNQFGMSD